MSLSPWTSVADRLKDPECLKPQKPVAKFLVNFLDKALQGIYKSDVILLAAKTGAGKTELSTMLALNLASQGKRVNMIALESDKYEIERRLSFKEFARYIFSENNLDQLRGRDINYVSWDRGDFEDIKFDYTKSLSVKTLYTSYQSPEGFDLESLQNLLVSSATANDIVILDHIHYVDFSSDKENSEMKKLVKFIRSLAMDKGVPIILVSHLRKSHIGNKALVPDIEDIMGSSDLAKIATRAIVLAPCYASEIRESTTTTFPTFFQVLKNRRDGSVTRFAAVSDYDIKTGQYGQEYVLGQMSSDHSKFTPVNWRDAPWWTK